MIIVTGTVASTFNLSVSLIGVDGTVWDLVNGPVRLGSGFGGLSTPDPEHWWRDAPYLDGSFHLGSRIPRGEVTVPVRITTGTSSAWLATQRQFMASVNGDGLCQLVISELDSPARTLNVRLTGGLNAPYPMDPMMRKHAEYGLTFAAEYPYWTVTPLSQTFTGSTVGSQVVSIAGDIDPWPKWTLTGPYTVAFVGIYATSNPASLVSTITISATVTTGQSRIVIMDPRADIVAVTDQVGVDKWADVTDRTFAPIPVDTGTFYVITQMSGTGSAAATSRLDFTPAYRQAW